MDFKHDEKKNIERVKLYINSLFIYVAQQIFYCDRGKVSMICKNVMRYANILGMKSQYCAA